MSCRLHCQLMVWSLRKFLTKFKMLLDYFGAVFSLSNILSLLNLQLILSHRNKNVNVWSTDSRCTSKSGVSLSLNVRRTAEFQKKLQGTFWIFITLDNLDSEEGLRKLFRIFGNFTRWHDVVTYNNWAFRIMYVSYSSTSHADRLFDIYLVLEKSKAKVLDTKRVFWFSVQYLSGIYLVLKRMQRDAVITVPGLHVKYSLF
jgi:hypothetical protein